MSDTLGNPALIGSLITSFVAISISVASGIRDNRVRRKIWSHEERMSAAARERADFAQASLVTCIYFISEDPNGGGQLHIAVSNRGRDPVLSVQLESIVDGVTFSLSRKSSSPGVDIDLEEFGHNEWAELEFLFDDGAPILNPGQTYLFTTNSSKRLGPADVMVRFAVLSGNAYENRGGTIYRYPKSDLEFRRGLTQKSSPGLFTEPPKMD